MKRRLARSVMRAAGFPGSATGTHSTVINGWIPRCENHLKDGIFVTDSVPHIVKVIHDKSVIRISWANTLNLVEHDSSADQRSVSRTSEGPRAPILCQRDEGARPAPRRGSRQYAEWAAGLSRWCRAQGTRPHSLRKAAAWRSFF